MSSALLTTGEAARLCAVKPDTVLKWIKKGALPATRTIGGHYRVDEQAVLTVLAQDDAPEDRAHEKVLCSRPMRCWEYMNNGPGAECRECVVYKIHASWCFRMSAAVRGNGQVKRFCTGICQECPYYRRVHNLPSNVIVITQDEKLIQDLAKRESPEVSFRFARRGYDASAIVSVFRPAFVVFDQALLDHLGVALLDALATDSRTLGARILVAVRKESVGLHIHHRAIYATIQEPFQADEIVAIVNRIPVEGLEPEPAAAKG
jgi:excisionase family DNA binding protein